MKEHFIKEINKLKKLVAKQATQVEVVIQRSIEAVDQLDTKLAEKIISSDGEIDEEEIRIEEECLKVLALYQPVATDLRVVISILKINAALERIADYGGHIAKRVSYLATCADCPALERMDFHKMESTVLGMLRDSVLVMENSDTVLAYKVIERDDDVDTMHTDNTNYVAELLRRNSENVCYYLQAQGVSRDLERIADLASDICENIVYLETGKIIRHRGA